MDSKEMANVLLMGVKFGGVAAFIVLMFYTFGLGELIGIGKPGPVDAMPLREIILFGFAVGLIGSLVGWLRLRRED